MINIPSHFNQKQIDYIEKTKDCWLNVAEGGKRGSKNVINSYAYWLNLEFSKDKLHLIAGVSQTTAKMNILDCDDYGLLNYFNGRSREGKYKDKDCLYIDTITGKKIVVIAGGDKQNSLKYIKGFTLGSAYVTEANECHITFINEVRDRVLASNNGKIFHDLNPKNSNHEYYREFLNIHEEKQKNDLGYGYNYGHFTIADNSSISNSDLIKKLNTYDKNSIWYKRDILGMRESAEGLIYGMFRDEFIINSSPIIFRHFVGVDYGHSNATVFLLCGEDSKGVFYILDEFYHSGTKEKENLSPKTYAKKFTDFIRKNKPIRLQDIVIDPSAKGFKAQLREEGVNNTKNANNDVIDGIYLVSSVIDSGFLRVHQRCKNTINELKSYCWDERASEKGEDAPLKKDDHCMDALRYVIMRNKTYWKRRCGISDK